MQTAIINIFIFVAIAVCAWIILFVLYLKKKRERDIGAGLNLALFIVSLQETKTGQGNPEEQVKSFIFQMEQFLSGLATLKRSQSSSQLWKHPAFALEIAAHNVGSNIYFYVAFPRAYADVLRSQLHGTFPDARIDSVPNDYNIFNPEGATAIAVLSRTASSLLPIKTYKTLGSDPVEIITSAFSKLHEFGQGAAIQLLIRIPSSNPQKRFRNAIFGLKEGKSRKDIFGEKSFFEEISDLLLPKKHDENKPKISDDSAIKMLEEKSSKLNLECNIRIVSSAKTVTEADQIIKELKASFLQFQNPDGNGFKIKELSGRQFFNAIEQFSFRLFDEKNIILLNTEEIASIYHFPYSRKSAPRVQMLKYKEAPPPANLPKEGIIIGRSSFRGEELPVRVLKDDFRRHFYIVGQTGVGKSVLLENMAIQNIRNGDGVCILDPHGELIEKILPLIPKERVEDVIYFNPGDTAYPMGLNMLEYDPKYPEYKSLVINELLEIFNKLFNMSIAGGPMFEQYFRNSAALVMEDPESGNTVLDIQRVFADKEFRDYKLSKCKNPVITTFWRQIAEKTTGEQSLANMSTYVISKFDVFLSNDIMRPIIMQEKSAFNVRDIMDNKKILLIDMAKGKLGETNSYLIGLIIVGKILISALSRTDIKDENLRNDFYLYIDEFQNVTTKSNSSILSEARKYRLILTIAHQFLGQITDEEIKKSIFGNVGNILSFRVGSEDAEFLEKQFAPVFAAQDLTNLDNAHACFKPLINGLTTQPFNIKTYFREKGDPTLVDSIKQLSRLKYGKPREEIEAAIMSRYEGI